MSARKAKARAHDAGNGNELGDEFEAKGPGTETSDSHSQYNTARAEPSIINKSVDPVRTWRAVARHMSDHDLRHWRARADSVLIFAAFESPYPEHDKQIVNWQIEAIEAELEARRRRESLPVGVTAGFSDTFIADLKERVQLHELIENGGDVLSKAGQEYRGNCPFHESKSRTSLTVSPDKGLWHCHGCGKGGDAITWICERWGVEFPDAVRILATLAGVEIPKQPTLKRSRRTVQKVDARGKAVRRAG
jgi:hypothetical protein